MTAEATTGYRPRRASVREGSGASPTRDEATAGTRVLLALFIASLLVPVYFHLGGLRLSPSRLFLLATFVPLAFRWISGAAGRVVLADVLVGLHCAWIGLALIVVHGPGRIPFAGSTTVELFGGYLVGRTLIRSAADYRGFFRYFTIALVCLAPFAMLELMTGRMLLSDILGKLGATFSDIQHTRLGFHRVQAVFEHPILFGLFCSVGIANLAYIYRHDLARSALLTGFITFMTFCSLSSAALLSAMCQFGLTAWDRITRGAWWPLVLLTVAGYVTVDALSNRTPVTIVIDTLTLNSGSAWYRLAIWDYGIAEVWRHPVFGIGLNDWQRASWMWHDTVDNFWLVVAMRYGIPGFLLLAAGIGASLLGIMRQGHLSETARNYRTGYVIAMVGLILTLSTVHIWGATSVFVMCYIGAGVWFFNGTDAPAPEAPARAVPTAAARAQHRHGGDGDPAGDDPAPKAAPRRTTGPGRRGAPPLRRRAAGPPRQRS